MKSLPNKKPVNTFWRYIATLPEKSEVLDADTDEVIGNLVFLDAYGEPSKEVKRIKTVAHCTCAWAYKANRGKAPTGSSVYHQTWVPTASKDGVLCDHCQHYVMYSEVSERNKKGGSK